MKTINTGKGSYGYTYIITVTLGSKVKEERYNCWFDAPDIRDRAMQLSKGKIKNASKWKRIGR